MEQLLGRLLALLFEFFQLFVFAASNREEYNTDSEEEEGLKKK